MYRRLFPTWAVLVVLSLSSCLAAEPDGTLLKTVLDTKATGEDLLKADAWRGYETGFVKQGNAFSCDNGTDAKARRGVSQQIQLDQKTPQPIVAVAWSKAEGVGGSPDSNYALYLDLIYMDGTPLWGQTAAFTCGTHDWERREVVVTPERPVKSVSLYLLLRGHSGKAAFRGAELREVQTPPGACLFDGVPVATKTAPLEGFQLRDVAANSSFVRLNREALGIQLTAKRSTEKGTTFIDVALKETTGKDRAVTLVYAIPVTGNGWHWLADPRSNETAAAPREYLNVTSAPVGTRRLSRYPFAAIADAKSGMGLGIDMLSPAFFRAGFNAGTRELFVAFDLGFAPEKSEANLRICLFHFEPAWRFRAALSKYYDLLPAQFTCRTPQQGLWMPFAKISEVKGWEDFGFRFKEGHNETAWDDAHEIVTFRYTEPMTWWMKMPKGMPRTLDAAQKEAERLAAAGDASAKAFLSSGFRDPSGDPVAQLQDTPWCDGAVWSMNSMPDIADDFTDFKNKWSEKVRNQFYGPDRKGDLDGEYIDSSEGYVTAWLDFRRDHFSAAQTPLTFSPDDHPAIFRGQVIFEYVRGIARDVHGMKKLMMANGTPQGLCWLAPLLDVMGTETDWNHGGKWQPMAARELLYRRALCKGKPYCFLMNTRFEAFSNQLVEKYMKRSLAYGMFPGFFSADASNGHYFSRPELYDRDRPLFKKYIPLCRLVAEAGWEPVTKARSSDEKVHVERFGERYLTIFNDSDQQRTATITLDGLKATTGQERVHDAVLEWKDGKTTITLGPEDVVLIDLR